MDLCYVFLSGDIILLLFNPEFSVSFVPFFQCLTTSCLDVQWVAAASILCHCQMDIEAFGKEVVFLWPRRCFITRHGQEIKQLVSLARHSVRYSRLCSLSKFYIGSLVIINLPLAASWLISFVWIPKIGSDWTKKVIKMTQTTMQLFVLEELLQASTL